MSFERPTKLIIGSVDDQTLDVEAQYNPKDLQIAKTVPWAEHDVLGDKNAPRSALAQRGELHLEFTGRKGRTMSLELLFDGFETNTSVEPAVAKLEQLASPLDATSPKENLRRPHRCVVAWGTGAAGGIPPFRCVIESVTVKYTMFARNGIPLRASCTVQLKEATMLSTSEGEKEQYTGVRSKKKKL
jgi:hypothetical protein